MPDLPARPGLEQLRHQARDLLRAAAAGVPAAVARIAAVAEVVRIVVELRDDPDNLFTDVGVTSQRQRRWVITAVRQPNGRP